jgi:anti-sigma factor RsiW
MNCIDRTELEQFLSGKLAPERLLAVDEHVSGCAECKKLLVNMPSRADFGATLMGATDCPEYEELSAYTDESLDAARAGSIRAHANLCELCTNDIERIRELRSHAALRGAITVKPGMTRQRQRSPFVYWKQALAAVSLGGVIALAVMFGNVGTQTAKNTPPSSPLSKGGMREVAVNPPVVSPVVPSTPKKNVIKPEKPIVAQTPAAKPQTKVAANPTPAPAVAPVLKDGSYSVIRSGGALALAKKDGTPVRTALEARIAANIDEKLRTGKIKPVKPVQVAMASINVRGSNGYEAPPTAPKQIAPMGKMLLSQKPTFTWSAVDLAEAYRVRVFDNSGNLVMEQVVKHNSFTASKPLARGKVYSWRVGVRFSETDQWAESAAVGFAVLSAEDYASIKRVQSNLPGSHLALGAAYESAGLYDEAAAEYRALQRANPDSKLAAKMLRGVAGR